MSSGAKTQSRYTAIPLRVLIFIAWRNLTSKKLRTFLTTFGIIIGIGAIFFLVSFGLGLRNLVTQQVIGDKSIKSIDVSSPNSKILHLDDNVLGKVRNLPHVTGAGASYSFPGSLIYKSGENDAVTYGVDASFEQLDSLNLSAGRLLTDHDADAVVLNMASLKAIGITNPKNALNKKVVVNIPLSGALNKPELKSSFKVVGVIDSSAGTEVYLPKGIFQAAGVPYYSDIKLTTDGTGSVSNVRSQIESMGLLTSSPIDTLSQINQIFKFFTLILVGFGGIGMIVSVLGMFNTLTISLLERTREIGLMIALGGRNSDMRKLFIFEACLLSVFGALLGVVMAWGVGQFAQGLMNAFAHRRGVTQSFQIFSYPWWLVGASILFMLVVGLIVVYFPAKRAQHISPIDALRRE